MKARSVLKIYETQIKNFQHSTVLAMKCVHTYWLVPENHLLVNKLFGGNQKGLRILRFTLGC